MKVQIKLTEEDIKRAITNQVMKDFKGEFIIETIRFKPVTMELNGDPVYESIVEVVTIE